MTLSLSDLPSFCYLTLLQLARALFTCPDLQNVYLKRIAIPASVHQMTPEPVELRCLRRLSLNEVDISKIPSIVSLKCCELDLALPDIVDDNEALGSLWLFSGRNSTGELTLILQETRSDVDLTRLLHSITGVFECVGL